RVGVKHDVAVGGQHVHFVNEAVAVLCIGATVNLDDERVLARGIEAGRLEYPAIHRPAVRARVGDVFGSGKLQFVEQVVVERGQAAQSSWRGERAGENFSNAGRVFDEDEQRTSGRIHREIERIYITRCERGRLF